MIRPTSLLFTHTEYHQVEDALSAADNASPASCFRSGLCRFRRQVGIASRKDCGREAGRRKTSQHRDPQVRLDTGPLVLHRYDPFIVCEVVASEYPVAQPAMGFKLFLE